MCESGTIEDVTSADPWQGRLDRIGRAAQLPLLAVSTVMAWLAKQNGFGTPEQFRYSLILAAGSAAWTLGVTMRGPQYSAAVQAIGLVGHTVLAAVLVGLNPWYGIFAFTGYMLADRLPRTWAKVGVVVTALVMAASQTVGYPFQHPASWLAYLIVSAVNTVLALTFISITDRVLEQNSERGRMVAELKRINDQRSATMAENDGLHAQLVVQAREAGVLDERQRLAGEIHDTLAQGLIGIVTQLEAADQAKHVPNEWQRHLDQARELARASLIEARRSVRALRPEQLEHATLTEALDALTHAWTQTSTVPVRTEVVGSLRPLAPNTEAALFRVAQEAFANIAKHAHASKVWLTLTLLEDVVLLDVRDDGVGWAGSPRPGGYGLEGMRARLARVGGTLEVETAPGEGTALSAAVPTLTGAGAGAG